MYINQGVYAGHPRPEYRLDVTTGRFSATTRTAYAADIRSRPRGLVVGDTWETGTTTDGGPSFRVVGSRLAPQLTVDSDTHLAKAAFDTATRRTVQLRLPPGYHPRQGASYGIFEWLDDDTIALTPDHNLSSADILTCQLSDGRCRLAVPAGPDDVIRILPSQGLPG